MRGAWIWKQKGAGRRRSVGDAVRSTYIYKHHKTEEIQRTQRRALLRVISGYRTISAKAVQVIAGVLPIDLLEEERYRVHESGRNAVTRMETISQRNEQWQNLEDRTSWTRRLIPNIRAWVGRKHRQVNFYLTQFLSGHGSYSQ